MPTDTVTTAHQLCPNVTYHLHRPADTPVENWLIIGTGPTAAEDWDRICTLPLEFLMRSELVLLNRAQMPAGLSAAHAHHHVTYHSEHFHLTPTGLVRGCPRRHSNVAMPWTTDCWAVPDEFHVGGSAFLAAYIAKQLRVKRAVLIGCPLSSGSAYTPLLQQLLDAPKHVWHYYRSIVSSMSGATRDLFGAPSTI